MVGTRKAAIKLARLSNSVSWAARPLMIFIFRARSVPMPSVVAERTKCLGAGSRAAPAADGDLSADAALSTVPPLSSGLLDPGSASSGPPSPKGKASRVFGRVQRASDQAGAGNRISATEAWGLMGRRRLRHPKRTVRRGRPVPDPVRPGAPLRPAARRTTSRLVVPDVDRRFPQPIPAGPSRTTRNRP